MSQATWEVMSSLAIFVVGLGVYIATLMPSIPGGDSGELVAEACELGTAHPPGYPLYTLVVHLLTFFNVDGVTMAWKANAFCAALGAAAAVNISASVQNFSRVRCRRGSPEQDDGKSVEGYAAGAAAGLLYAFSPLVWTYSVGSEVFAMNNFFASLIIRLTVRFATEQDDDVRYSIAYVGALVCGLGMCNQHTLILYEIPLILFILWTLRPSLTWSKFAALSGCFFGGLLPYAYLPIASINFPKRGAWGDMSTLTGFWRHLRRADYGTFRLYSNSGAKEGLIDRLAAHANDFASREGLYVVGPLFAVLGLAFTLADCPLLSHKRTPSVRRRKAVTESSKDEKSSSQSKPLWYVGCALFFTFAFYEVGFHSLSNLPLDNPLLFGVHARFWMQPNIILFVWVGCGFLWAYDILVTTAASFSKHLLLFLFCSFCALLVGTQIFLWQEKMQQRDNFFLDGYARGILESIPVKALFFTNYDQQWTATRYLHVCEGLRKDLPFINLSMMTFWWFYRQRQLFPEIVWPRLYLGGGAQYQRGEAFNFKELLDANKHRFEGGIYLGGHVGEGAEGDYKNFYESIPHGLLSKLVPRGSHVDLRTWLADSDAAWAKIHRRLPKLPSTEKYDQETWEWTVGKDYWDHRATTATYLLDRITSEGECGPPCANQTFLLSSLVRCANELEDVIENDPAGAPSNVWKNLGISYSRVVQGKFPANVVRAVAGDGKYPYRSSLRKRMVELGKRDDWMEHASQRTLESWRTFVNMPGAESDSSFATIKSIVDYLSQVESKKAYVPPPSSETGAAAGRHKRKRKKKPRSKKKRPRNKK